MNVNLEKYKNLKICVAVSGGKDSMALLHYLVAHGGEYAIEVSALNCDHCIRGEASARDSAFVREYCKAHNIPLLFFCRRAEGVRNKSEASARLWRLQCFSTAHMPSSKWNERAAATEIVTADGSWRGVDAVATAHHLDDNAETVLFRLARGCGLAGASGIADGVHVIGGEIIHPLIACPREEIDRYVSDNAIPYVEDESNFTDDYTRNKIRHHILPALEEVVPGAAESIYRFSRLAAEDEEYLSRQADKLIVKCPPYGDGILFCEERVLFKRAALQIAALHDLMDYTFDHAERLYRLQFCENGKKFEFLGLTAFKEEGKIVIVSDLLLHWQNHGMPFVEALQQDADHYCGQFFWVTDDASEEEGDAHVSDCLASGKFALEAMKTLRFDVDKIPDGAVVRFMREGDVFRKFGGGSKKLGDYFTDKKIPVRVRHVIPLVAAGNEILVVGGVEISDAVKVTENTEKIARLICADYAKF